MNLTLSRRNVCFNRIFCASVTELDDLLQELDEDVEGMQSTILFLQQELKTSKDVICGLELEIKDLKIGSGNADRHEDKDDDDCIDIVNDQDMADDDAHHRDKIEMAKKQQRNHHLAVSSYGNGIPAAVAVCAEVGNDNEALVNSTATITNCSVVLRAHADREVLKLNNSERILRRDKQSVVGGNKIQPRTLRSSRRNDVARTIATPKVINKNSVDAEETDVIDGDDNDGDDEDVEIGGERNGDHRASDDVLEPKSSNNKRAFDESESAGSSDDESGSAEVVASALHPPVPSLDTISCSGNHKQSLKKARRSSVLSLDLNEEDSQIDCGEEDRTIIVNSSSNGTKAGRTTD